MRRGGVASGRVRRALTQDEVGDGLDRPQYFRTGVLVADLNAERSLEFEHQFEHVDGIEAKPFTEEGRGVVDVLGRNRQTKATDDRLFQLASSGERVHQT